MSIYTPTTDWDEIQDRTIDPQSKYDSDIINKITSIGGSDRYKVSGLMADLIYDSDDSLPYLHVTDGIAVKDNVVIKFTDESFIPFHEAWPTTQGIYYLAIDYIYEKQSPPPAASLVFISENEYDPLQHFPLYQIFINGDIFPDNVYIEQLEFGKDEEVQTVFVERMSSEKTYISVAGGETEIEIVNYFNDYTKEYAVYINGVYQMENVDYAIDTVLRKVILTEPLQPNDIFIFMSRQWGRPNSEASSFYTQEELNGGILDTIYYNESEIDDFFEGEDLGKKQVDWQRILNTPTTIDGYGITEDIITPAELNTHADTTINVHGIVDTSDLAYKSSSLNQFADITSSGADIEDAVTKRHEQNTDSGTSSTTFHIGTDGPLIKNNAGDIQIRTNLDDDFANIEVGNLTVRGTTTTLYTEEVSIDDNIIVLNSNATGTPTENAGVEINRGDYGNANIIWDETNVIWKAGIAGNEKTIIREDDLVVLSGDVSGSGIFDLDGMAVINTTIDTGELSYSLDGGGAFFAAFNGGWASTPEEAYLDKYKIDCGNAFA